MIPLFALLWVYYDAGMRDGQPEEKFRFAAAAVFLLASISDGIDGFIARRFNQMSELGKILDPIADKGLLITALLLLSWHRTEDAWRFPLWFPVLVVSRDVTLVIGYHVLHVCNGKVEVCVNWVGKTATVFQMVAILSSMLHPPIIPFMWVVLAAGILTAFSFALYVADGIRQLNHGTHTKPL